MAIQRKKKWSPEHHTLRPFEHHLQETMAALPHLQRKKVREGRQAAGPGLESRLFSIGLKSPGLFFYSLGTPGRKGSVEAERASGQSPRLVVFTFTDARPQADSNREAQ